MKEGHECVQKKKRSAGHGSAPLRSPTMALSTILLPWRLGGGVLMVRRAVRPVTIIVGVFIVVFCCCFVVVLAMVVLQLKLHHGTPANPPALTLGWWRSDGTMRRPVCRHHCSLVGCCFLKQNVVLAMVVLQLKLHHGAPGHPPALGLGWRRPDGVMRRSADRRHCR